MGRIQSGTLLRSTGKRQTRSPVFKKNNSRPGVLTSVRRNKGGLRPRGGGRFCPGGLTTYDEISTDYGVGHDDGVVATADVTLECTSLPTARAPT